MPIALFAALGAVLLAPAAASACASLAGVHSFSGHAFLSFDGTASGPIEGTTGSETIALHREAASLKLNLPHKVVGKGPLKGVVIFSGKASLGTVTVHDNFELSGDGSSSGSETYSAPAPPRSASVTIDTDNCRYVVSAGIGVKTKYSGDPNLRPGAGVSVGVFGDRNPIPTNLHLAAGSARTDT